MADRPSYPGTPRWVKVAAAIAMVMVVLVGIVVLSGVGGSHGPGRHFPSSGTPPTQVERQRP
jgi:hypothetical protein